MRLSEGLAQLRRMEGPILRTNDAAAVWRVSRATASKALARLASDGHIERLTRSVWLLDLTIHPWKLHPYLSDPAPSYLSLQTALFHHGMIEQIPTTVHMITTAKTKIIKTTRGIFLMHQVAPDFFCGFEPLSGGPAQMARPEKALVDFFYFGPSRTRAFRSLPELELPKKFSKRLAHSFAQLIESSSRRSYVECMIKKIC